MHTSRLLAVKILQKTKLNKVFHKLYYNHVHGFNTANDDVLPALEKCIDRAIELGTFDKGDYYEFGIFKGYAFWYAQHYAKQKNLDKCRFFGFDSFAGLPEVTGPDATDHNEFYEGQYSCSKENVTKNLDARGVDWDRTTLIEGYFDESLRPQVRDEHKMAKLALGLIDCDLYSSTVQVLDFINDMIMDNTLLMFDDWNCFEKDDARGQRKAMKEFLAVNNELSVEEFMPYGLYGQVFIMHR